MRTVTVSIRKALFLALFLTLWCEPSQAQTTMVFVGNQGNFTEANGSVTAYDPTTGAVVPDAVPNLNTLVQSITLHEGRGYVMANTSDRVDVFDLETLARTAQILDVPSPRYMAVVGENKAYVTNLFSNTVTILDLANDAVLGTIPVGDNPEGLAVRDDRAYVANSGFGAGTTVTVIDTSTDTVVETREVGCDGPRFLAVDAEDELWVFCTGKTVYNADFTQIIEQTNGQVAAFDETTGAETARFALEAQIGGGSSGQDVFYDPISGMAFALTGLTILPFDTHTNEPGAPILLPGDTPAGGLAYDGAAERFFVGRVPSFTEAGFVTIHDAAGNEVDRFDAGVAPASVALYQPGLNVAVEDEGLPADFRLGANYPNPFNPATTLPFELARAHRVSLKIFNLLGEEVATLVDAVLPAGRHTATWRAAGLPSGLYLARLQSGASTQTRPLTLLK